MDAIDVSTYQGPIDWARVKAAGVTRVSIRCAIGTHWVDDRYRTNWADSTGIPRRGVYNDVVRGQSASAQVLNIISQTGGDFGNEACAVDVERTNAERAAMEAGTLVWPKEEYTQMLHDIVFGLLPIVPVEIYTSAVEWAAMTTQPDWAIPLLHWIAHYNDHIANPDCPPGWKWNRWQYGQRAVGGIANPVDVSRDNPTMMKFERPTGDYIGIHSIEPGNTLKQVQDAAAAGTRIPAVVQLNDAAATAGYAPYIDSGFCRYYSAEDDSLQGVDDWTEAQMTAWSNRRLDAIEHQATDAQIAQIRGFLVDNEPDPPENPIEEPHPNDSYTKLGLAFMNLITECEKRNAIRRAAGRPQIHLGIGCLPQGVPEWFEMVELVDTGLFQLIRQYGHTWVCHEGVYEHDPIDKYYGDQIPGSPIIPGAGAYNFRWIYLFSILLARNLLVPILIAEFYDGGGYPGDPDEHVTRFSWYDVRIAALPRELAACVIAICGFTCNPNAGWIGSNYDSFYLSTQLAAYRQKVRYRINGGNMTKEIADADWNQITASVAMLSSTVAKYETHVWAVGDIALAAVNPLWTYDAPNGPVHDKRPPTPPGGPMITYDLTVVGVTADQLWLEVAPNLWVKTADVKLKV